MSIPNEAVEAAAKAFIEHGTLLEALEAAAPYIADVEAAKRKLVARAAGVDPDAAAELGY